MNERIRLRLLLAVAASALLALAAMVYFLVEAKGSLEAVRRLHSLACRAIRTRAFLDIEAAATFDRAGLFGRADERLPGVALGDYVAHCASEDGAANELADKLNTLVANLHRAHRADDLDVAVGALSSVQPVEWGTVQLPADPALAAETTHLIGWETDESVAKMRARAEGKGVMLFPIAAWCLPCEALERTLGKPGPYAIMTAAFVPLRLDVSIDDPAIAAARARYRVEGDLPRVQFFDIDVDRLVPIATISEDTPNYLEESGLQQALAGATAARVASSEGARR